MKSKLTIFIAFLTLSFSNTFAQNQEDLQSLSIFSEYVKSKNYDSAYTPWMELRKRNPRFNKAIFVYGERILNHKIKNSTGDEVQGLQMGAVDFVAKPIEPTILRARVNTQVRLAKANRQLETLNKELEDEREAMLKFIALTQKNARLADEMTRQLSR